MNVQNWLTNFKEQLNYLGDRTITSIKKGLDVASEFMRDAGRGADPTDVQTAAVKWQLSQDASDEALQRSAHLDLEKALSPGSGAKPSGLSLTDFINAKEQEDYRRGRYTTTGNAAKTPRADIMQLQRELNAKGFTDKFGQMLKADGILGSKTQFAIDQAKQKLEQPQPAKLLFKEDEQSPAAVQTGAQKYSAPLFGQQTGKSSATYTSSNGYQISYADLNNKAALTKWLQYDPEGMKEFYNSSSGRPQTGTDWYNMNQKMLSSQTANSLLQEYEQGLQFIKDWEGCRLKTYYIMNRPTVGYGHDMYGQSNIPNQITQEQADKWFEEDVAKMRNSLVAFLQKNNITLSQQQFNAMLSFTYNHGENCWNEDKDGMETMREFLKAKNFSTEAIYKAFSVYINSEDAPSGLSSRRIAERKTFLKGTYSKP